jgi:hypothetical protein
MVVVRFLLLSGKVIEMDVAPDATLQDIKDQLLARIPNEPTTCRFIVKHRILAHDTKISSLNLGEKDYIIVHAKAGAAAQPPPAAAQAPPAPAPEPSAAPPPQPAAAPPQLSAAEFEQHLQQLCEAALRAAQGDRQLAFEFLQSGHIPTEEEQQRIARQSQRIQQLRAALQQTPPFLEDVVRALEARQPELRTHPELLLQDLGLDPAGFDLEAIRNRTAQPVAYLPPGGYGAQAGGYGARPAGYAGQPAGYGRPQARAPVQPQGQAPEAGQPAQGQGPSGGPQAVLARFPTKEKEAILRLRELGGWPLQAVIEAFLACDKDEHAAATLLFRTF